MATCDLLERTRRMRVTLAFPGQGEILGQSDHHRLRQAVLATMAVWHTSDLPTVRYTLSQATAILTRESAPIDTKRTVQTR